MSKTIYIIIFSLQFFNLFSQDANIVADPIKYNNAIKISPFEFRRSEFQLVYERKLGNGKSSISIMPSLFKKENDYETISGYQFMSQFKFFLSHFDQNSHNLILDIKALDFYSGPYALFGNHKREYISSNWDNVSNQYVEKLVKDDINAQEVGAVLGLQIEITPRVNADIYLGGGIRFADKSTNFIPKDHYYKMHSRVFELEYSGVKPRLGFQFGITF